MRRSRVSYCLFTAVIAAATLMATSQRSIGASSNSVPSIICPSCHTPPPSPTPTPHPKQTPIRKQDPINPSPPVVQGYNYHTFWQWDAEYYNAFVQVNDSGLSVNNLDPNAFITNEEWRNDGSGNTGYWQEVGYVAGQLNVFGANQYYTGIFGASNEPSSGYMEFPITTNPQPYVSGQYGAWVALSVQTANHSLINIMYNNATYGTVQAVSSYSGDMQVGMESNSSNPAWNPFYQEIDLVGPELDPVSRTIR